jgi:hypothetical protein
VRKVGLWVCNTVYEHQQKTKESFMKKMLLTVSLLICSSTVFGQQAATGLSRVSVKGQMAILEIKGPSAELLYKSMSVEPMQNGGGVKVKATSGAHCYESTNKKSNTVTYKCDRTIDLGYGAAG